VNLADLRRTTIRKSLRIRFQLPNGLECVVNEHGIAQIPALRAVPDFDLEEQLAGVREFTIEQVGPTEKGKSRLQPASWEQVAALAGTSSADLGRHDDHDE
jgi:hypothetical protein